VLEFRFPLRVESFSIRRGSGGGGQHKGGDGIERKIKFLAPMTVGILANRREVRDTFFSLLSLALLGTHAH